MYADPGLVRGLGAYPVDECYDAQRPSWLSEAIDTMGETECKLEKFFGWYPGVNLRDQPPNPPAPPPVGVPPINIITGTNVTPDEAQAIQDRLIAAQTAAWKAQTDALMARVAADIDEKTRECPWYQVMDSSNVCGIGGWKLWAVALGGAAAAVYIMAGRR